MTWEFTMKEPQFTYIIQALPQLRTMVQVADQAELLSLLVEMHRAGILIESVQYAAPPGVDLSRALLRNGERIADSCG